MKDDKMLVQVSRVSQAADEDGVQLEIADDRIHIRLHFTMEEYAKVVTGEAHVPVKVSRFFVREDLPKSKS